MEGLPAVECISLLPSSTEQQINNCVVWMKNCLAQKKTISIVAKSQGNIDAIINNAKANNSDPTKEKVNELMQEAKSSNDPKKFL